jgi:hypothetical protein
MTTPQELVRFAYMWARTGPIAMSGDITGYRPPDPKNPEREIYINDFGSAKRPSWRYMIYSGIDRRNQRHICTNWHFRSAEEAYDHALAWSSDQLPKLRAFEWFEGHFAHVVDGLHGVEVVVVELKPGYFVLRTTEKDRRLIQHHDPAWRCPMDALAI